MATDGRESAERAKFLALRRERAKEIRDSEEFGGFSCTSVYFLLEPDVDLIRYVGIASCPESRFYAYTQGGGASNFKVREWIDSLKARGTLPRMWVVATIQTPPPWVQHHVDSIMLARAAEKRLVATLHLGGYYGNGHIPADLLNIEHMPDAPPKRCKKPDAIAQKNFLSDGLDMRQDRR